jgi:CxxC-x17-CxxC domain-containing protein
MFKKTYGKGGFKGGKGGSFGGKPFKKRSFGGQGFNRGGERAAMHSAVCDKCKQECEVPFKPSGDRPVLCNNCFKKPGDDRGGSFVKRDSFERKDYGKSAPVTRSAGSPDSDRFKRQFDALNEKLDRIIRLLDPSASLDERAETDEDEDDETGGEE